MFVQFWGEEPLGSACERRYSIIVFQTVMDPKGAVQLEVKKIPKLVGVGVFSKCVIPLGMTVLRYEGTTISRTAARKLEGQRARAAAARVDKKVRLPRIRIVLCRFVYDETACMCTSLINKFIYRYAFLCKLNERAYVHA